MPELQTVEPDLAYDVSGEEIDRAQRLIQRLNEEISLLEGRKNKLITEYEYALSTRYQSLEALNTLVKTLESYRVPAKSAGSGAKII